MLSHWLFLIHRFDLVASKPRNPKPPRSPYWVQNKCLPFGGCIQGFPTIRLMPISNSPPPESTIHLRCTRLLHFQPHHVFPCCWVCGSPQQKMSPPIGSLPGIFHLYSWSPNQSVFLAFCATLKELRVHFYFILPYVLLLPYFKLLNGRTLVYSPSHAQTRPTECFLRKLWLNKRHWLWDVVVALKIILLTLWEKNVLSWRFLHIMALGMNG